MPYIHSEQRADIAAGHKPHTPGQLNYVLTKVVIDYVNQADSFAESYDAYNEVLGVLSAVGYELYRRRIAPYEDRKAEENGDVY